MPITVTCPKCSRSYRVGNDKAGRKMRCKQCTAVLSIPEPDDEFGDEFEDDDFADAGAPARPRTGNRSQSRKRGGKSKSKKSSSGMTSPVQLIGGGVVVLVTVGIVLGILYSRGIIGGKPKEEPKEEPSAERAENTIGDTGPIASEKVAKHSKRRATIRIDRNRSYVWIPFRRPGIYFEMRFGEEGDQSPVQARGFLKMGRRPAAAGESKPTEEAKTIKTKPAESGPQAAARRTLVNNKLKGIALAMLNYHEANGKFPLADFTGTGLSWRVALLPYIGQRKLYEQFHLDEPWDSPHNKSLVSQIPSLYQSSNDRSSGMSAFHVFVGPGVPFGSPAIKYDYECHFPYEIPWGQLGADEVYHLEVKIYLLVALDRNSQPERRYLVQKKRQFRGSDLNGKKEIVWKIPAAPIKPPQRAIGTINIVDGTSNTLLAVHAGPESETEWTKPSGIPLTPSHPLAELGTISADGVQAVMFDGSIRTIPADIVESTLRSMIQYNDGRTGAAARPSQDALKMKGKLLQAADLMKLTKTDLKSIGSGPENTIRFSTTVVGIKMKGTSTYLVLKGSDKNSIWCYYSKKTRDQISKFKPGQKVVVEGTFLEKTPEGQIYFVRCQVKSEE